MSPAGVANINPLNWLGEWFSIYVDDDPLWSEMAQFTDEEELNDFFEENYDRFPIALQFEVKNAMQLGVFMAGLRTFIEQASPGMYVWELNDHKGQQIHQDENCGASEARQSMGRCSYLLRYQW